MRLICLLLIIQGWLISYAYDFSKVNDALSELRNGNVANSVDLIRKGAAVNDMAAQFYLGQCYENGIGIEMDLTKAFAMYRRAAERGFAPAMKELARCYKYGIGVNPNDARYDEWISRYAKRNDVSVIPDIIEIFKSLDLVENNVLIAEMPATEIFKDDSKTKTGFPIGSCNTAYTANSSLSRQLSVAPDNVQLQISDVDVDIPLANSQKPELFVLIIANENYQDVAKVPNALNDGEIMAKYCLRTLGIPQSNIHLIKDATLNNIKRELNLLSKIAEAYAGNASFIIYYAGHGFPDEKTRDAFLMPIDGYSSDLTTCFSLSDFYDIVGRMPSQRNIILLDACFSGAARNGDMIASARGVVLASRQGIPSGNTVVITSATGDETAYAFNEEGHGMFTYFILKKLKETKGNIGVDALVKYVRDSVTKKSLVINGKSQTPTIVTSPSLGDTWKDWKLN